jgi:predicted Fe-S protein YdhL (DUF1289 family)
MQVGERAAAGGRCDAHRTRRPHAKIGAVRALSTRSLVASRLRVPSSLRGYPVAMTQRSRPLFAAASAYAARPAQGVPSPCVSVCQMNAERGQCEGCFRTIDEIAHWGLFDDDEKRAVLEQLPARRAAASAAR